MSGTQVEFSIEGRRIGYDQPSFIIAEACENHLGDMDVAREMVVRSKLAGADAVKFQHHLPDEEMLPNVPMSSNFNMPLYDFLKKYSLTLQQHQELKAYCEKVGIIYMCTPFCWRAAEELTDIGVTAFKIGSGELTDIPTLVRIASLGKPMIVSTGMSTFEEIDRTYEALSSRGVPLALTNCLSEYPPLYQDLNLRVISQMQSRYPAAIIGHSDHTPEIYSCLAAVPLGAAILEKHVIVDKTQPCPDQSVSIDFSELAELVDATRKIEKALGSEKKVHKSEQAIRSWAHRSLVSLSDISEGTKIEDSMVWSKRPGTGIPAFRMDEVVGKVAKKPIKKNSLISWDDLT